MFKLALLSALFVLGAVAHRRVLYDDIEAARLMKEKMFQKPGRKPMNGEYPCPDASAIAPCVCTKYTDLTLSMNCSLVKNDEEIANAFKADFPQKEFNEFIIESNYDIRYLMGIFNGVTFRNVDVRRTNVSLVSSYAFEDSKSTLEMMYFDGGQLNADTFPIDDLEGYSVLRSVYLDRQRFTWFPKLTSSTLQYIIFYANGITSLEAGAFENAPSLLAINLARNQLTQLLPNTVHLPNKRVEVAFDNNLLQEVQAGAFVLPADTSSLEIDLTFRYNFLKTIDEPVYGEIFPFINYIQFFQNPLECGCDIAWIVTNATLLQKVSPTDTCASGEVIQDLDPAYYRDNC